MTVIRPNSISGITSLTAHRGSIDFYAHDGSAATFSNINSNVTSGVSTFASLNITGDLDVGGALTYEDVTNVDSIGVVTARNGIDVTGGTVTITTGANSASPAGSGDNLVIKDSDGCGLSILSGNGNSQNIYLGSVSDNDAVRLEGFYNSGSPYFNIYTAGSERLRIASDGKLMTQSAGYVYTTSSAGSLSLYGGNTNLGGGIVLSGGNADGDIKFYAQMYTATPAERLRIASDGDIEYKYDDADTDAEIGSTQLPHGLRIYNTNNTLGRLAGIHFSHGSAGTANAGIFHETTNTASGSTTCLGDLVFYTKNSGVSYMTEKLRITSDGNVGINETNPLNPLHILVDTASTQTFTETGNGGGIFLESNGSGGAGNYGAAINFTRLDGSSHRRKAAIVPKQFTGDGESIGLSFFTANGNYSTNSTVGEVFTLHSDGNVSVNHDSPNTRLYVRESGASISNGNAILNSTQKGIRLVNSNNDDTSLGLWFTTGDSHHSGISGERNDSANTWGTDLRFYTHEDATNDLTYTRERLRINPHGLLINRKGQNAVNTGGNILGRYKYTQQNQGSGYAHLILGPDGRKLQDYVTTNCYCIITVTVTGTGTNNMFCQYYYHANSSSSSSTLTHMYGNSGASSNRPYMNLQNTHDPAWLMSHNGGYRLDIEVAIYGGASGFTYTTEFGDFTTNP